MKKLIITLWLAFFVLSPAFMAINSNQLISNGKSVFTSSGNANYLADNSFNTSKWTVTDNSWIAIPIDSGPTKVFFNWNNPDYWWASTMNSTNCDIPTISIPVDYNILISSNSTNGSDGTWTIVDSIRGNFVTTRGHIINTSGAKWVKMQIVKGSGQLDEVQLFDLSNGGEDTWFFAGTSISANAFKGTPPQYNYADIIHASHSTYFPAMVRGAIACISSNELVANLSKYLKLAGNVKFWAIEMGTNDAWGGTNGNVNNFKTNMQKVIDSCKVHGIQPILARILATNASAAKWQVHPDFEKAVDDLTKANNLIPGPDLYTWFLAHPDNLNSDGIHPNNDGAADIQRLWALKMDSLYGGCNKSEIIPYIQVNRKDSVLAATGILTAGDTIRMSPNVKDSGTWSWTGAASFTAATREITINKIQTTQGGYYTANFTNNKGCTSIYSFHFYVLKGKTGIESLNNIGVTIFPNPAKNGNFMITLNNLKVDAKLQVFDLQGKMVFTSSIKNNKTEISTKLPEGLYTVKIINGNDTGNIKLIIK